MSTSKPTSPADRVGVVVVSREDAAGLSAVVAAVEAMAVGELVVIDDGSVGPEVQSVLDGLERRGLPVARQDGGGASRARNLGTRLTTAPYLLHLDTVTVPADEFVIEAAVRLDGDPTLGVITADSRHRATGDVIEVAEHDPTLLVTGNQLGSVALIRRRALEKVGGFDEGLVAAVSWDLWLGMTSDGWRFAKLPSVGFEVVGEAGRPLPDDALRVAEAVAIAEKHQGLFVRYLPSLVSNYQTALLTTGPGSGLTGDAAANRDLADQIAELRAALSVAEQDAVRARERVAEVDADRWSAEVARESLAATEASLRETVAAMSEAVRIAEAERAALQQLLDDHRQTRSYRWMQVPRQWYARVRRSQD